MHTLYWYGRTLYFAVYLHTFIKKKDMLRPARTVAGAEIAGVS